MSTDNNVFQFKVVKNETPETDAEKEQQLREEHEHLVKQLMDDGPFQFIMGIARRRDGSFMTFGSSMDLRDYVFSCEFLRMQAQVMMLAAYDDNE